MMTITHFREAWTYARIEIDAAIQYLEAESADTLSTSDRSRAAGLWLINLRRNRIEYDVLLTEYPMVH